MGVVLQCGVYRHNYSCVTINLVYVVCAFVVTDGHIIIIYGIIIYALQGQISKREDSNS